VLVLIIGVVVLLNFRQKPSASVLNLTIWGTDEGRVFKDLTLPYTSGSSKSKVNYVQIDPSQYKTKLLAALAAGTGPDIFEIGNRDLEQWQNVLAPLPAVNAAQFNLISLENDYPSVVEQDFTTDGQIYALPFSVDTLAMIYNKDIFDSAGIAFPPKTWDDFQKDVSQLRILNPQGQITRAGAAIGGSGKSIANSSDIIFLLMMQNGTQMIASDGSTANFATGGASAGENPGLDAFNFYLQFANAASPYYTWNDSMGDAVSNFIQGKTAILFGYKSMLGEIKDKAPFLNMGVAAMPQPTGATIFVNYPKYLGLAVPRTGQVAQAWDFVLKLAATEDGESTYAADTGAPPALRSLIAANMGDPVLSIFASQALTARSWRETDAAQIDGIMDQAIQSVENGSADSTRAIQQAQAAVNAIQL